MARPHKITPEIEKYLVQLLQAGSSRRDAADACGICDDTITNHCKRSSAFSDALRKAEGEAAAAAVLAVRKAFKDGTWQAAAWWLERRRYQDWGRKDRMELTGRGGGPVNVHFYLPTTDAEDPEEAMLARIADAEGGDP